MMATKNKYKGEGGKGEEEYYKSMSRKELQCLCKKYGLPARKSTPEMAQSLFLYFQKKDLSLASSPKSISGMQDVLLPQSSLMTLQPEKLPQYLRDNIQPRPFLREECNQGNRNIKCNGFESYLGFEAYNKEGFGSSIDYFQRATESLLSQCARSGVIHKESLSNLSGRVIDTPQCCSRNINRGVCPEENFSPTFRTYAKVPASFEFYVSSEGGIKLCVDLNSRPSDWIKNYSNQISLCNNVGNVKSQNLHQELGRIGESNKQIRGPFPLSVEPGEINYDRAQEAPSTSCILEKNNVGIDHLVNENKSSAMLPARPCSAVHTDGPECLDEDHGIISSKPSSDVQKKIICNTESCSKNRSTTYSVVQKQIIFNTESCTKIGCSGTIDSDIMDTPSEKSACNFVVSSISDGSVGLIAAGCQNSKHDDEVCEDSNLQNCSNLENNCVVIPGCMISCSTELQLSEDGNYYKDTSCTPSEIGEFLDLDGSKHNIETERAALGALSENEHSASHLPTCSEEREWSNVANGRESSVCSQVDNSDEKTCLKSENLESNEEFQKKRPFVDTDGQNSYSKHDSKILRSMRHAIAEVTPRRSMRLVSKLCALQKFRIGRHESLFTTAGGNAFELME